jgi:hypothetical protein
MSYFLILLWWRAGRDEFLGGKFVLEEEILVYLFLYSDILKSWLHWVQSCYPSNRTPPVVVPPKMEEPRLYPRGLDDLVSDNPLLSMPIL